MRIIAHLDMDAFFAAVEERDHEWLKGKPVVVGADPKGGRGRGVVSTANYKAREYGIRSALPISMAWQFSETARKQGKSPVEFLRGRFERYEEVSNSIFTIVRKYASLVEEASIDEAYLDLNNLGSFGQAVELCKNLKAKIFEKENLTCSIGIGPNKLIAKIASDIEKPDGLTVIESKDTERFLEPLPIRKIPGIGPKTEKEFIQHNVKTVRDLKKFSPEELYELMGKGGLELYDKIRGVDDAPVTEEYEIKSIGEQETFEMDSRDPGFLFSRLEVLCRGVMDRFKKSGFKSFRTITVMVRFDDFQTKTRAKTLAGSANNFNRLHFEALKLLTPFLEKKNNPHRKSLRLIGVRVEKLA